MRRMVRLELDEIAEGIFEKECGEEACKLIEENAEKEANDDVRE